MNIKREFFGYLIFSLCVFNGLAESNAEISKEWQVCKSNDNCTAGVVCCECWEAINKQHIDDLINAHNHCKNGCDGSCRPQNKPVTACVQGQCQAMYEQPRTNVTMEQWTQENSKAVQLDSQLAEKAMAVLEVEANDKPTACEKYCSQRVRILKVLNNKSDYIFPESIDVYFYSWKKEIPNGRSVIYLEKYNPDRNDLWKLVDESLSPKPGKK